MKRLFACILASALLVSNAFAGYLINPFMFESTPAATYLINEDFSGTSIPSNWSVEQGSPDFSADGEVGLDNLDKLNSPTFTAQSTVYIAFAVRFDAINNSSGCRFLRFYSSGESLQASLDLQAGDAVRFNHGSNYYDGPTVSASTVYYFWASYTTSGDYTLRMGTTGTYSSSTSYISKTNGTSTGSLNQFCLTQQFSDTGGDIDILRFIVDDVVIGDFTLTK